MDTDISHETEARLQAIEKRLDMLDGGGGQQDPGYGVPEDGEPGKPGQGPKPDEEEEVTPYGTEEAS